jgi:prolipoprotein diacylglyceryltransferase
MADPVRVTLRDQSNLPVANSGAARLTASSCMRRFAEGARRSKNGLNLAALRMAALVLSGILVIFDAITLSGSESKHQPARRTLIRLALKGLERLPKSQD